MAYRQLGGQAKSTLSWDVTGGQARVAGGQARAVGGQARTVMDKLDKVSAKHANQPFPLNRCELCSFKQLGGQKKKDVYHKHFSSKNVRELQGVEGIQGDHFCPTCKNTHSSVQPRLKICLSDSTLHEFWAPRGAAVIYEGDQYHTDYITIPGGSIIDLIEAWKIDYLSETRGMDVFLVGGLNNIKNGDKPETIMRDYDHLVQMVHYQANKHHVHVHNTCAIGTLFYPPQLCWFDDQGVCPPHFENHLADMQWINGEIERLNFESGIKVPNFTTFGLRVKNSSTKDRYSNIWVNHTTTHRYEHWREPSYRKMLHLNDEKRMKLGRQVGRYFWHETKH